VQENEGDDFSDRSFPMFWLDTIILITLGAGALFGALSGLLRQVARIAGFCLALYASIYLNTPVSQWFGRYFLEEADPRVVRAASYAAVFVAVLLLVMMVTFVLEKALVAAHLKPLDRLLGAGLGFLKTGLILGALLLAIVLYAQPGSNGLMEKSVVAGHMVHMMEQVIVAIPGEFKEAVQTELNRINLANLRQCIEAPDLDGLSP
jgi:membrane protein required for colicin V production